ncbi:hypothetical protein [Microbacterium sp. W4I20]|nr:hypothetical protein [Microbacterium sp. W4I20]MDQ0726685.1 hypothetical protein [Microbacterium sp. W4I20]
MTARTAREVTVDTPASVRKHLEQHLRERRILDGAEAGGGTWYLRRAP